MIARLQQVAALGELVHLREQFERAPQRVREIHDRMCRQRAPVLRQGDLEHPPHGVREHHVQVAGEPREIAGNRRGHAAARDRGAASTPRACRRPTPCTTIGARLALVVEEVVAQAVRDQAHPAGQLHAWAAPERRRTCRRQRLDVACQHGEAGMKARSVREEGGQPSLDRPQRFGEAGRPHGRRPRRGSHRPGRGRENGAAHRARRAAGRAARRGRPAASAHRAARRAAPPPDRSPQCRGTRAEHDRAPRR